MGVAAMPSALALHEHLGPVLAGLGLLLGVVGMFTAVLRGRGTGFGLSLAGTAVCGSVLIAAVVLFGKGLLPHDRQAQTDAAKQDNGGGADKDEEPAPNTGKGKPPPGTGSRPNSADGIGNKKVADLVRALRSERSADRIRAAEQLGKLREEAKSAARALCEAAATSEEAVRQAALEALERVHPALYKPVLTLLVDNDPSNQLLATRAIKDMGEVGKAATPVVHAHLRRNRGMTRNDALFQNNDDLILEDMAALRAIAPDEPDTLTVLMELTTYEGRFYQGGPIRAAAATALGELATRQPDRRQDIVKTLVAATQFRPKSGKEWGAQPTAIAAINALAMIGPHAKEAIPELKKLKLSSEMAIREAAAAALEKIETGTGEGGRPKNGAEDRAKRSKRWTVIFNTRDGNDYKNQLKAFGVILAIPDPKNAGGYLVIRDLDQRPVQPKPEDVAKIERIYWTEDQPASVQSLSRALGLIPLPAHFLVFFSPESEEKLLKLELSFRGKKEPEITETRFEVRRMGQSYEPIVVSQR
jgi:HEAT repeat protein